MSWYSPCAVFGVALSRVRLLVTSWTAAYQAPPSMGFSRLEYWSGLPFPSPWGNGEGQVWEARGWGAGPLASAQTFIVPVL